MKYPKISLLIIIFALCIISGCSKSDSPVSTMSAPGDSSMHPDGIVADYSGLQDGMGLWGEYSLSINPLISTAEISSARQGAIGESYIVNGKSFFTIAPCTNCLKIKSVELTSGNHVKVKFIIRHPFQPGDPLKPPSGKNRLDLDIFDTALLVRPVGLTPSIYSLTGVSAYTGILYQNAGYTSELTNVINDPAEVPYVLVIDDNESGTSTYNKFAMGAESEFSAEFILTEPLTFDLYLTMGYGASAKKSQRLNPVYYNPEFNRKSAWKVKISPPNDNDPPAMGNTWNDKDSTTPFPVRIEVFDWQIGANVNPDLTNPTDIFASSGISKVSLEIPGMTTLLAQKSTADSGIGTPSDPLVYTLSVANEHSLPVGEYIGLIKVSDERSPGTPATGGETDTLVSNSVEKGNEWFSIPEFATIQTFTATVVQGCGPVTGQIISPTCPITGVSNGARIDFGVSASSNNGGDPVVLYEADYDYDGANFSVDASNTDGIFNNAGPFLVPDPCNNNIPRTFTVAFRGTDSCTPPNMTIFKTCEVTVDTCKLFVGDVTVVAVNRGESSADPELITSLDLDWDDAPGAVEYAVEKADGYTGTGWIVIGTSTTSFFKFLPARNDLDDDMRFRVIARAEVGGNPATDSDPSEEVFVLFMCNGGSMTSNYWSSASESSEFRFAYWFGYPGPPGVDNWPPSANRVFLGLYYRNPPESLNSWAIARTPQAVPDLAGQKRAFCDGYWSTNYDWGTTMGMCVGTLSNASPSGPDVCDFKIANTVYGSGTPYNRSDSGVNTEFCTSGQDAWVFTTSWTHVSYYLNDLCDDGPRDYIAFGWANGPSTNVSWISGYSDGFVFVVD